MSLKMNHDYAHCADFKYGVCPKECFRAQLAIDLRGCHEALMLTYMSLKGTEDCLLTNKERK